MINLNINIILKYKQPTLGLFWYYNLLNIDCQCGEVSGGHVKVVDMTVCVHKCIFRRRDIGRCADCLIGGIILFVNQFEEK